MLVMIRDAGGTVGRCLAYDDGTVVELNVTEAADDGVGAMSGAAASSGEPDTRTEKVRFSSGKSIASMSGGLTPGSSVRFVLGAKANQIVSLLVDGGVEYQIVNPDGPFLLDMISASTP